MLIMGRPDTDDDVVTGIDVEDSAGLKDVDTLTCNDLTASLSVSISVDTADNLS